MSGARTTAKGNSAMRLKGAQDRILKKLRRYSLSLPESFESESWDQYKFCVGPHRWAFAIFEYGEDIPAIGLYAGIAERDYLRLKEVFYKSPDEKDPDWIAFQITREFSWDLVEDLVLKSYKIVTLTKTSPTKEVHKKPAS
jgi:hypothetical protein